MTVYTFGSTALLDAKPLARALPTPYMSVVDTETLAALCGWISTQKFLPLSTKDLRVMVDTSAMAKLIYGLFHRLPRMGLRSTLVASRSVHPAFHEGVWTLTCDADWSFIS